MKKVLIVLFILAVGFNLQVKAYDFSAVHNGKTIYYNITSSTAPLTVEVTSGGSLSPYSGALIIPEYVLYGSNYYNVTSIESSTFEGCSGLNTITLPNSITFIGNSAFEGCSGLTFISLPNSITFIGNSAFEGCSGLNGIYIPDAVISIGHYAFSGCSLLNQISVGINNIRYSSIDGILYSKNADTLFVCPARKGGSITIPSSVAFIGNKAFEGCNWITSINIPNSVNSIESSTFEGCSWLTSINIPNSINFIGNSAFKGCCRLTSINIPNSVTSIGSSAFSCCTLLDTVYFNAINCGTMGFLFSSVFDSCSNLSTILIGDSVIKIPSYAFYNCSGLTSITIPNSVTSIGNYAFSGCSGLISFTIPNSINSIGNNAFSYCIGLTSFTIPNSVTLINEYAFYGCSGLMSITIPNSITSIGNYAFYGCSGLTTVTIPNTVTSIGNSAFSYCSGLTSIIVPSSVTSIEDRTFDNCIGLMSIAIPSSVTSIGNYAFQNCRGLTSITSNAINPPTIQNNSFFLVNKSIPIYIPCNSLSSYQLDINWNTFTNFNTFKIPQYITSSICDDGIYTYNGLNIDSAGVYNLVSGCDSIILTLNVGLSSQTNCYDTVCQGVEYTNYGFNFTADTSGIYIMNLQSIYSCDSVINLSLIVNPIFNDTIYTAICQGDTYNLFGFNESTSGFYTHNLQTINGCDSIINLNLIVNPIFHDTIHVEICQGETYNQFGFNENTAGFYTQNLQTIYGCDSVINLNLIVNSIYNDTMFAKICQGETYNQFGFNESTAGFYSQTLQTINGCDSIVNLNLIVNPTYLINHFDTICQGETYNNYGFNFTANTSGTYTRNFQSINGCDSIIILNLVVPNIPEELNVLVQPNYIDITWRGNGSSYVIYRNNDSLTAVTQSTYADYDVIEGQNYCYKVKSIIGEYESGFTDNVCETFYLSLDNISSSNIITKLFPNPSEGKAKLIVEGLNSDADVLVYDMIGRVIQTHKINKGKNELDIDLSGYTKGVYTIRIINQNINQTKKLIIQ